MHFILWGDNLEGERGSGRDAYRAECCCIGFSHDSLVAEPCPWIGYVPHPSGAVGIKTSRAELGSGLKTLYPAVLVGDSPHTPLTAKSLSQPEV